MTNRCALVVALGGTLAVTSNVFARQQVLKNGSFENATTTEVTGCAMPTVDLPNDWLRFGCIGQSSAQSFHEDFSVNASIEQNGFVGYFQNTVDVGENVRVLMQAMVYNPSDRALTANHVAGLKLEFFPASNIVVPPPVENLQFNVEDEIYAEDTWVPVSLQVEVPPDIDLARVIMISFDEDMSNGPAYCDSAFAELSSNPGVNILLNPSFESGNSGPDGMNPPWDEFANALSGARQNAFEVPAANGSAVLKFLGQTCGVAQQIAVIPGDTLTVSGMFRSRGTSPYGSVDASAGVKVEWVAGQVPSPNIDIAMNANPISATTNIIAAGAQTDQWLPVTIDYTMPDNSAANLRATIITGFGPGPEDVYFDAFEMVLANVFDGSDADGDDDEDLHDIAALQKSFTGSGGGLIFCGLVNDQDEDEDVDNSDADFILQRITGPAVPMP